MKFSAILASAFLSCATLLAGEVVLTPVQDRDVYQGTGLPTGTDYSLGVSSGAGHAQKSVIQFEVTGASTGMTAEEVGQATLRLYVLAPEAYPFGNNIGGDVLVSLQTRPWTEESLRWSTFSAGGLVNILTLAGDRPYHDGRDTLIYEINTWVEVEVTSAVKAWLAGEETNHGFLLEPDEQGSPFLSAVFADSVTGWKPELVITRADAPGAPLRVTAFSFEDGEVTLEWSSVPGRRYAVDESPDLGAWSQVFEVTADSGTTTVRFEGSAFEEKRAFYVVRESPATE